MNETLSRGKRIDNGEWIEGYYVPLGDKLHYILTGKLTIIKLVPTFEHFSVDPKTVGQYTGLTDKNGKKIFEGDIVEVDKCYKYLVPEFKFGITDPLQYWKKQKVEIIGNIHDNPELLGGD